MQENQTAENAKPAGEKHVLMLVLFWAYVLIPLAWGVTQTIKKAMALFA